MKHFICNSVMELITQKSNGINIDQLVSALQKEPDLMKQLIGALKKIRENLLFSFYINYSIFILLAKFRVQFDSRYEKSNHFKINDCLF